MPAQKKLISLLLVIGLLISIFITLILVSKRQEIRKRAGASEVQLTLYPTNETFNTGEIKPFDLKATFIGGSSSETIDYLKTEVNFSREHLKVPEGRYVVTEFPNQTNFTKIFRVDDPQAANDSGKIIIELGAATPSSGPPTDKPLTVARIYFEAVKQISSTQDLITIGITHGTTQVVNNRSVELSLAGIGGGDGGGPPPSGIKANLLLFVEIVPILDASDQISTNVGEKIPLAVVLQITDPSVKISAADFVLLYDKNRLEVVEIAPATTSNNPSNPFTDVLISESGGSFDNEFNFLRVAEVAKKPTDQLSSSPLSLANITFRTKNEGLASIKFPDDNKYFQITGIKL